MSVPDFYLNGYIYIRADEVQPAGGWRLATPLDVPLVKSPVTGDHLAKTNTGKSIGGQPFWHGPLRKRTDLIQLLKEQKAGCEERV